FASAGLPAARMLRRSSSRRSFRAASLSACERRRYSCQSADDSTRTRTLANPALRSDVPPLQYNVDAPQTFPGRRRDRVLLLLQRRTPRAAGLDGHVRVPVAALVGIPVVGVGAARRAPLGLVAGVPDRLVAVLLRPHPWPAEEVRVGDLVALADVEFEG